VHRVSGGRINPGPTKAELAQSALLARARRPVPRTRRIVVLSRKGGVGKTTTTLMLGHTFASIRGDRVVALDANPDAGNLGQRVPRETNATVTSLLAAADSIERYTDIRVFTSQAETRLEVIASDDDPRITSALGMSDYRRVIDTLDRHYTLMIIDTGTGILDDAIQGILGEADQLIVVMPPALDGARVAAGTLDWLDQHRYGRLVDGAIAVVNGVRDSDGLVDLAKVDAHFAARCSAVVRIPWDRTLEAGAQVQLDALARRTRSAYLELAAAVADRFADPPARVAGRVAGQDLT
jgi:putative peptide zinc metalloprotease protein